MREYLSDLTSFMTTFPPHTLGIETNDPAAFALLLETLLVPHEAAAKVKWVLNLTDPNIYALVLAAYYPVGLPAGEASLPLDPKLRYIYENIRIAEMHFLAGGIIDLILDAKSAGIGRIRAGDAGSHIDFEIRGTELPFLHEARKRRAQRAHAALARAGFFVKGPVIERVRMQLLVADTYKLVDWFWKVSG